MQKARFHSQVMPIVLATAVSSVASAQCVHSSPRVTSLNGTVTEWKIDANSELTGVVGATLGVGDRLATADNSGAEVRIDNHVLRLGANTELRVDNHVVSLSVNKEFRPVQGEDSCTGAMALDKGTLVYHVLDGAPSLLELNTPSVTVEATAGKYLISVTAAGESEIVVKDGAVFVYAPTGSRVMTDGQKMLVRGPVDNPEYKIVSTTPKWLRVLSRIATLSLYIASDASAAIPSGGSHSSAPSKSSTDSHTGTGSPPSRTPPSVPKPPDPPRPSPAPSASPGKAR